MNADQELRSLKRGLKVLSLLNQIETIGISELARRLELPRTTAERILMTLASEGYVQRLPNDKRYRLSAKVCTLAGGFSEDSWIIHVATPLLFDMTKRIGWPLAIATSAGEHMVLRVTTDPATSLWLHRRYIGAQTPMLGASSGLVSFAFAPPAEKAQLLTLLKNSIHPINRERAASKMILDSLIAPVLANGYAFQPPPTDVPECSISVPIIIDGVIAAVLLMMYMPRALDNETLLRNYLPVLRELADTIGNRVSHHGELDDQSLTHVDLALPPAVSAFGAQTVGYAPTSEHAGI
jgi:IclR family transcriptional regulator, mhp operon transcriptional activator